MKHDGWMIKGPDGHLRIYGFGLTKRFAWKNFMEEQLLADIPKSRGPFRRKGYRAVKVTIQEVGE